MTRIHGDSFQHAIHKSNTISEKTQQPDNTKASSTDMFDPLDQSLFTQMTFQPLRLFGPLFQKTKAIHSDFENLLPVENGIMMKPEVKIENLATELRSKFSLIYEVYEKYGYADQTENPVVITSGNDSGHVRNSYHYKDQAIDLRGKHVPDRTLLKIGDELQQSLGPKYRVLVELFSRQERDRDHIHIAYLGDDLTTVSMMDGC